MVDRFICYLVLLVFPATHLANFMQWISIEVALAIVWATTILVILIGVVEYVKNPDEYDSVGRQKSA